jgi:hypothetical protein
MSSLPDQAQFFRNLYAIERSQDHVIVSRIRFDGTVVSIHLSSGEVVQIPPALALGELFEALGGEVGLNLPSEDVAWIAPSTVGAQWAELHYDLGATGPRMQDFDPELRFESVRLDPPSAFVTIGDDRSHATATVDLASAAHDMGLPIELAEAFVLGDRPDLLTRTQRP